MNRVLICFALVLVSALPCAAIPITFFVDTPTFVERSRDIIIAKCIRPDLNQGPYWDNLHPAEVEVLTVLKGDRTPGKMRIATIYELKAGKTYLLASGGGLAYETSFLAIAERAVVEVPAKFRLDDLKGKKVAEQVQAVFTAAGLRDSDLLSKKMVPPIEVLELPPDAVTTLRLTLEQIVQKDRERVARAAQQLQQAKSEKEIREALREMEEAVQALKARLAKWEDRATPSTPKKP
jgi:hypothetical protein